MTQSTSPHKPDSDAAENTPETEAPEAAAAQADEAPAGDDPRIAALEEQLADMKDRLLRAMAETENIRKRSEREKQDTAKFAVSSFAKSLLSVADNLSRALAAVTPEQRESDPPLKNIYTGVEMTEKELLRALEKEGIKKIDAMDKPFDPNLHEVMFEGEAADKPPGTVIQVIEDGYTIFERLLRPARVGVSKGGVPEEGSTVDQEV
ncbi:MAG: nucleotide exchange factor GrpE [Alphaproteobacteria bacterium]|nr:nucleotide exchange factor GrpE [Alphaproteobacteria bacterium]